MKRETEAEKDLRELRGSSLVLRANTIHDGESLSNRVRDEESVEVYFTVLFPGFLF